MHLADFIRSRRSEIVAAWEREVRQLSRARELDRPALLDHVPLMLDDVARSLEAGAAESTPDLARDADVHAMDRVEQGFDLRHLLRELAILRGSILELSLAERPSVPASDLKKLLAAVDAVCERSVERFFAMRSKLTEAFERVATAAVESDDLDAFLAELLQVFVSTAPSVDTIQVLLRDGNELRARAGIGLDEEVRAGITWKIGEGFAGTIAETKRPLMLHDAAHDPIVVSAVLPAHGTKALYGVPLLDGDYVVGVAHVGSQTAHDIPEPEKRLFHAVAQRATSAILKQSFRYAAAHRAAELEAIIEAIPDPVFVADAERFVTANRAQLDLFGMASMDELRHFTVRALIARSAAREAHEPAPMPFESHPYARALRGERATMELVFRHPLRGQDVHVRLATAPVLVDGRVSAVVGVATDISARKSMEKERDDFLNAIVHDLRNPLTAIRGSAQLVGRELDALGQPRLVDAARRIQRNADNLNRMLADLLDTTLASSGRLSMQRRLVDVGEVLEDAMNEWVGASAAHSIEAKTIPDVRVYADPHRIRQVLANLVSNAVKYSPGGGRVLLEVTSDDEFACVRVSDQGIGIREEDQPRIFERYARALPDDAVRGHGLGLFVAHEIVKAHGGSIGVESTPGRGSTFWFTLPRAEADTDDSTIRLRRPAALCKAGGSSGT